MKKILIAGLLGGLAIAGCSEPIKSGTVIDREYDDPDTWTHWQPIYRERCEPRTRTETSYVNGKSQTRTVTRMECRSSVSHHIPVQQHDGPHWRLKLRSDEDVSKKGWITVSQNEYERYTNGMHYPDSR